MWNEFIKKKNCEMIIHLLLKMLSNLHKYWFFYIYQYERKRVNRSGMSLETLILFSRYRIAFSWISSVTVIYCFSLSLPLWLFYVGFSISFLWSEQFKRWFGGTNSLLRKWIHISLSWGWFHSYIWILFCGGWWQSM